VIHRLITQWQEKADTSRLCQLFEISRSGYYAARQRQPKKAGICSVSVHLRSAFAESGRSYGSRRLQVALRERGVPVGRYRVRCLMKQHQLRPTWRRKFVHTTDSNHNLPVADNVLDRQFEPAAPNLAWVSDITYIRTRSGWLYLAVVMDLFSRKVVGWAMAPNMRAELVCMALQMAIAQRQPAPGLIVHSDRGSQYASAAHREVLDRHHFVASMSRKGNCWDNAAMERFFLSLKMERVWQRDYANQAEAVIDVADYIVSFYNSVRLHSKRGYLSPAAYEQGKLIKTPIVVSEIT